MPVLRWTDLAEQQLLQIRTRKLDGAVVVATEGLVRFPLLCRPLRQQEQFPQLERVRDFTLRDVVRVLYEYDERREVVWILGLLFPGQELTAHLLGLEEG